jgi:hypothetical protein
MFLLSGIKVVSSERIIIGFNDIIAASYLKTALKKADILSTYQCHASKQRATETSSLSRLRVILYTGWFWMYCTTVQQMAININSPRDIK